MYRISTHTFSEESCSFQDSCPPPLRSRRRFRVVGIWAIKKTNWIGCGLMKDGIEILSILSVIGGRGTATVGCVGLYVCMIRCSYEYMICLIIQLDLV